MKEADDKIIKKVLDGELVAIKVKSTYKGKDGYLIDGQAYKLIEASADCEDEVDEGNEESEYVQLGNNALKERINKLEHSVSLMWFFFVLGIIFSVISFILSIV